MISNPYAAIKPHATKLNIGSGDHPMHNDDWIDIDLNMVDTDIRLDARHLPLEWTNRFIRVYSGHVLEHFSLNDVPKLLRQIKRVCKSGAEFVVVGPALDLAEATHQPNWLLDDIRASADPGTIGYGHMWTATSHNTLELVQFIFPDAELVDIASICRETGWPNQVTADWQVAIRTVVHKKENFH